MNHIHTIILLFSLAFLCSCSPRVVTTVLNPYPSLLDPHSIVIYEEGDVVPDNAETIGNVSVENNMLTIHCGYNRVLFLAKEATSKAGGNGLYIVKHKKPELFGGSCHQISALMLYLGDRHSSDTVQIPFSGGFAEINQQIIQRTRQKRTPPSNIISLSTGYGWMMSTFYDGCNEEEVSGMNGMESSLKYEHVWRSGWSLGLLLSRFKAKKGELSMAQYQIAPQMGYWGRRNHWLVNIGIGGGYLYNDSDAKLQHALSANLNIGTEYMLTRFLGIGIATEILSAFYFSKFNKNYIEGKYEVKRRVNLTGGLRFYF